MVTILVLIKASPLAYQAVHYYAQLVNYFILPETIFNES